MTLGNMRHPGVQQHVATCLNDACRYRGAAEKPRTFRLEEEMVNPTDGTKVAPHGMFYMEGAGGCHPELDAPSSLAETHQPSCFGQEEEKGSRWKGAGATV